MSQQRSNKEEPVFKVLFLRSHEQSTALFIIQEFRMYVLDVLPLLKVLAALLRMFWKTEDGQKRLILALKQVFLKPY